ncbi:MAG: TrbC/VirB2 family protein [Campylobacterales bacterium]|nr:TrbC/VirB2 family protein [Campylobacterales bacterium]
MKNQTTFKFLGIIFLLLLLSPDLFASSTGMPWEGPLENIKNSLSGPVAGVISLIGVIAAGSMLLFAQSGDFGGTFKTIVWMVLIISLIITANVIINFFTASGALIVMTTV